MRRHALLTVLAGGAAKDTTAPPSTLAWATGVWANGAWANNSWVGMVATFLPLFYPATVEPEMNAWQTFTYTLQSLWASFKSIFR